MLSNKRNQFRSWFIIWISHIQGFYKIQLIYDVHTYFCIAKLRTLKNKNLKKKISEISTKQQQAEKKSSTQFRCRFAEKLFKFFPDCNWNSEKNTLERCEIHHTHTHTRIHTKYDTSHSNDRIFHGFYHVAACDVYVCVCGWLCAIVSRLGWCAVLWTK